MSESLSIDPKKSALLLMDFQGFVLNNFLPDGAAADVVKQAARLLAAARRAGMLVVHITVAFRPGYPEITSRNRVFSWLKDSGLITPGSDQLKINLALTPADFEPVVVKHRVGGFTGTDLERLLRAQGIEALILSGVTTAGVVLSTVRQAFDLDYDLIVVREGCADVDGEVHNILIDKVIAQHALIASVGGIEEALGIGD